MPVLALILTEQIEASRGLSKGHISVTSPKYLVFQVNS